MEEDNGYKIYCSRCGSPMSSKSRYCMKCGNLNYDHNENESMRPFIENGDGTYEVGSGIFVPGNKKSSISIANNTGSKKLCYLINFVTYIFLILIGLLVSLLGSGFDLEGFINSNFPYISLGVSFTFLYVYSLELIFMKANERWWSALIPVYNLIILARITFKKKWLGLITLIPGVGLLFSFAMIYKLGERFKHSGLLTVLFSIIYIPVIGFGSSLYEGHNYIDYDKGEKSLEIDYKNRKNFFTFIVLFLFVGCGLIVYSKFSELQEGGTELSNYYYVYASNSIAKKTQKAVSKGNIVCSDDMKYSNKNGVYYFQFADFRDTIYLPFYYLRDVISGYIKIDNSKGDNRYYISLSDGEYGIKETLVENVDVSKVIKLRKLEKIPKDAITCRIEK